MGKLFLIIFSLMSFSSFAELSLETKRNLLILGSTYLDVLEIQNSKPAPLNCNNMFDLSKSIWESKVELSDTKSNALVVGIIEEDETLDARNIEKKWNRWFKKLVTRDYYRRKYHNSKFLHEPASRLERDECKDYKLISSTVVEKNQKLCRENKFARSESPEKFYYMTVCENDSQVYLNFHPDNDFGEIKKKVVCK